MIVIHISIHNKSASVSYSPNRFHPLFQVEDELVEDNWVHILAQLVKITFIFWDPYLIEELRLSGLLPNHLSGLPASE